MRRFLGILGLYAIVMFTLHVLLDMPGWVENVEAQSGRTFYIDFVNGSNSQDGTEKTHTTGITGPWKSAPGMQTGSGCSGTGSGPSYSHQAGDHFIFKGGVTWTSACFGMTISQGGTSASTVSGAGAAPTINGADYYGVDTTWFSGGSFTRPIFDAQGNVPTGTFGAIITVTANNVTLDDIETAHNQLSFASANCSFGTINLGTTTGVTIDRMYLHDWTIASMASFDGGWHSEASICSNVGSGTYSDTVYNTTMSDQNTTASPPSGVTCITGQSNCPFGTCFVALGEVAYNDCHFVGEGGLFDEGVFHDNQIHDLDGSPQLSASGVHSNGFESDGWPPPFYNNLMYNLNVDYNALCFSARGTYYYNNVVYASKVAPMAFDTSPGDGCASSNSNLSYAYNNTLEANGTYYGGFNHNTIRVVGPPSRPGTLTGVVTLKNNINIGAGFDLSQTTSTPVQSNNYPTSGGMSGTEASNYGFIPANKMAPSSTDPNTAGQGANLTSLCSGNLSALCQDDSGTPWFGGSPKTRPTGSTAWDLGAFQGQGGSTGPPTVTITSPTCGATCTGTQTITVTATPQGSATITSCQATIDGFTFGSPDTSSPYTWSWDTNTASNARAHTIGASCTDSNNQVGNAAATVSATPTNSHPNGFVSDHLWSPNIPNQSFTAQTSGTVTYPICIKPYTSTNSDNEVGLSTALPTGYNDFSALIAIRGGYIQVYNGTLSGGSPIGYTTDGGATAYPVTAGTKYCFNWTVNMATQQSTVAETSPSVVNNIATNFGFRAASSSLAVLSAYATNDSTPDTVEVSGFGASPTLSYSPGALNFGNVVSTMTSSMTENVTVAGTATVTSAVVTGTGFSGPDMTSTCPTSGSISSACTYVVDCTPPSTGIFAGTLTITSNAAGSPQVNNLSCTGVSSGVSVSVSPATLNFGGIQIHPTAPVAGGPIQVTVLGGSATISVALGGANQADFGIASNTCTGSVTGCNITPNYSPQILGGETATLTLSGSWTNSPIVITLNGTGVNSNPPAPSFVWNGTCPLTFTVPVHGQQFAVKAGVALNCNWDLSAQAWGCTCVQR